ncbi:hypothetical protein BT93_H2293 [Corymbia citriodora subsp. variegata]|nr:hypothetical protein BT93_H2293 [Corymbia citriodora subsp. variegata]
MRNIQIFECKKVVRTICIALKITEHRLLSPASTADGQVLQQSKEAVAISNGTHLLIGQNFRITTKPSSAIASRTDYRRGIYLQIFPIFCVQNHEQHHTSRSGTPRPPPSAQDSHSASIQSAHSVTPIGGTTSPSLSPSPLK